MCVSPWQATPLCQFNLDPPVFLRFTRWCDRRAQHLHSAVGIRNCAALFIKRRRWKDHISVVGRLSYEDVLHHKMIQFRQGIPCMFHVGVRHRWILAKDIHRLDLVLMHRVHNLGDGEAFFITEIARLPNIGESGAHTIVCHRLIIWQEHRDQTRIRRALHVVLSTQWVQTCARTANMAAHERKRDQAARVVGAVDMLADTHAPEDHTGFGSSEIACNGPDRVRVDAAQLFHLFRWEPL